MASLAATAFRALQQPRENQLPKQQRFKYSRGLIADFAELAPKKPSEFCCRHRYINRQQQQQQQQRQQQQQVQRQE